MKATSLLVYGISFSVTFLISAMLWHAQIPGSYFVCADRGLILDFLPPFVHPATPGDFFIKPVRTVYALWSVYMLVTLLIPALCSWMAAKLYQRDMKRAWL
jgi:hypothetical protein